MVGIENLKLKLKLNGSFLVVFVSFMVVGVIIYSAIIEVRALNSIMTKESQALSYIHQTRQNNLSMRLRSTRLFASQSRKRLESSREDFMDDANEINADLSVMDSIYALLVTDEPDTLNTLIKNNRDSILWIISNAMMVKFNEGAECQYQFLDKSEQLNSYIQQDSLEASTMVNYLRELDEIEDSCLDYRALVNRSYAKINAKVKAMRDALENSIAHRQANIQRIINRTLVVVLVAVGLALLLILLVSSFLNRMIVPPVKKVAAFLTEFADGKFPDIKLRESEDEIGHMGREINKLRDNLQESTNFAKSMGSGNFDLEFEARDALGQSLLDMHTSLKESYEQEEERKFISEGMTQLNAVLRHQTSTLEEFGDNLLYCIIKYLGIQVGAFYVVERRDDDVVLEMESCYAYDRKKFIKSTVMPGEGVVGQAYTEGAPIYLIEVPDSYIRIRSGLGDTAPSCIYVTPLVHNDETVGVLEFASLKELAKQDIEFLEQATEVIASDLSAQKINSETKRLLEESQKRTEEMHSHEEELRQNMEELQATQEAMTRNEAQTEAILEKIQEAIITIDSGGMINMVNNATCRMFGYSREALEGMDAGILLPEDYTHTKGEETEFMGRRKSGVSFPVILRVEEAMMGSEQILIAVIREPNS